jgi:hypothetical protein
MLTDNQEVLVRRPTYGARRRLAFFWRRMGLVLYVAVVLVACGGGQSSESFVAKVQLSAATSRAQARAGAATSGSSQTAPDQLMNWAEDRFPQYFPSHSTTELAAPFAYRYYPETGVYLGIVVGSGSGLAMDAVYVMGGAFGNSPLYVGPMASFMTPVVTPLAVQATSQLNAKNLNIPAQKIPTFPATADYSEIATGGVAFADFLQEGQVSALIATNRFSSDPSKPNAAGRLYIYRYVIGEPVDVTSALLADTTGCEAPRRILVADFNGDGRPDAFVSCTGNEWGPVATWKGESPRLVLSQPDGTYKNTPLDMTCYCHAATAGDVNGDGKIDLIVSDMNAIYLPASSYTMLINDGSGHFTKVAATGWMAPVADHQTLDRVYYKASFNMELIDFDGDGKLDLFLGNGESFNNFSMILKGDGAGKFGTVLHSLPTSNSDVQSVDASYVDGALYEYLNSFNSTTPSGIGYTVRKWSGDFSAYAVIAAANLDNGINDPVFLMPYGNTLVPYNARFGLVIQR